MRGKSVWNNRWRLVYLALGVTLFVRGWQVLAGHPPALDTITARVLLFCGVMMILVILGEAILNLVKSAIAASGHDR